MNRANPTTVARRLLLAVLVLALAHSAALAQRQAPAKRTRASAAAIGQRASRAVQMQPHTFYGPNLDRVPASMTLRKFTVPAAGRAPGDSGVTRQTVLLTRLNPNDTSSNVQATSQNQHPFWTANETYIYFDSDRNSVTDPTESQSHLYKIYRMNTDGTGITNVPVTAGDQAGTDVTTEELFPAVTLDGNTMAAVIGGTISFNGSFDTPITTGFQLAVADLTGANPTYIITPPNASGFNFTDIQHPTWAPGSTQIAFAGKLAGQNVYHIFIVDVASRVITQETTGQSNDYAPAWSPDGNVIAFTTNAGGFSGAAVPVTATSVNGNDDIWDITGNAFRPDPTRVTGNNGTGPLTLGGMAVSNKNPAWSSLRQDPHGIIPNGQNGATGSVTSDQLLAFSTNRADTTGSGVANAVKSTFRIYWLHASVGPDPKQSGAYTVTSPESTGNPALMLRLSTPDTSIDPTEPSADFDPNFLYNEDYPAWPQYINSYRIAYQSDRGGSLNLWASTVVDINAPTLLKYDMNSNAILGVSRDATPGVEAYQFNAGDTIRFRVRVADYETGVQSAWVQIKDPDSAPQSTDHLEHKTYLVGPAQIDTTIFALVPGTTHTGAAYEYDSQAIQPTSSTSTPVYRTNGFVPADGIAGNMPGSWPGWNLYVPGVDDVNAFSGSFHPPDDSAAGGFWLRVWDDGPVSAGGHEPEGETKGDGIYSANWVTPAGAGNDWYLDVIVYDNATDPFDPAQRSNWKIYDNVWGFTTRPFQSHGQVLYVGDYDSGQKFFTNRLGLANAFFDSQFSAWPTESWMTEFSPEFIPTQCLNGTTVDTLINYLTPLGALSYTDAETGPPNAPPVTGTYDIWRILSRGPVPASVLAAYGGVLQQDPPDVLATPVGTKTIPVTLAERCVIWHAPYSGDLFVGSGTILDINTLQNLTNFVASGGRLFLDGEDIAWGLTVGGGTSGTGYNFLTNVMHVAYGVDFFTDPADYAINLVKGRWVHPISDETWELPIFHNYPPFTPGPPYDNSPAVGGTIYIGSTPSVARDWMALNAVSKPPNIVGDLDTPPATFIDATWPDAMGVANDGAITWHVNTPAAGSSAAVGKVVNSSVGWEAINPEYFSPTGATNVIALKNRRAELLHNVLDFLRTGSISGVVADRSNSNQVLGHVFIRAIDPATGATDATTYSLANGTYILNGLDAKGLYAIDAAKPGYAALHLQATAFHGGYTAALNIYLTQAQPGEIQGTVTDVTNAPVPGAIVAAVDITDPSNPNPPTFTATTATNGVYTLQNLPTSIYKVYVTNFAALGYQGSRPPAYDGLNGDPGPVTVAAATLEQPYNFVLLPPNGTVTGKVTRGTQSGAAVTDTGVGVPNATVTATQGSGATATTQTATTDANGNFSIGLQPGAWGIVASALGYATSTTVTVNVVSKQTTTTGDIVIVPLPPGTVSGLVATSSGTPITGATIAVTDANGNPVKDINGNVISATTTAATTVNGYTSNYVLNNVPANGTITITASKAGYQPPAGTTATQTLTVQSGQNVQGINFTLDPLASFTNLLSLVSAPYDYSGVDAATLVGAQADASNGDFLFDTWNPATSTYVAYPTPPANAFHLGVGYFLADSDNNTNLAVTTAGNAAPTTAPFDIQLQTGWNMIGDPFPFPIVFANLQVQEANGTQLDVSTAASQGVLGLYLWGYQAGNYELEYTLDPWRGYWLRAYQPLTLAVNPAAAQQRGVPTNSKGALATGTTTDGAWTLQMQASAGTVASPPGVVGVSRAATEGFDGYKLESPPVMGKRSVALSFVHTDWGKRSGSYSVDVRGMATPNHEWDFTVTSNVGNTAVNLTWPGLARISARESMTLTDLDSNTVLNMRNRSTYAVQAGSSGAVRHFKLVVSRAVKQLLDIEDVAAAVNPGRAVGPSSVAISYALTTEATVQINILQAGRRIRSVEMGNDRAAGPASAMWDLRSDSGISVSSGAYAVEIMAVDAAGNRVRRIVPVLVTR